MKIAIVCANINSIDAVQGIPRQNRQYDYFYYTENNLPFPLPNLNARMRSKYIKIMMHRFLPGYDAYIWIDGKVEVLTNNFVELMTKNLSRNDICIFRHQERANPIQEIEFIEEHMRQGSKYVLSRYGNQVIGRERELFPEDGIQLYSGKIFPINIPLYETTVFSRMNRSNQPDGNYEFEEWWALCVEYSCFDQVTFSKAFVHSRIHELDREEFKDVFKINKHLP